MDSIPHRPALRYYGGKWKLAPWIISHFPPHLNYVEPCGGAASVLLQKPRSPLETYNDLDGNVVNFFRVLRDRPDELIRKIRLTLWARAEYELSLEPCEDEVEMARRTCVYFWMSIAGTNSGWRSCTTADPANSGRKACDRDLQGIDLDKIAQRFIGVQIEHLDALEVIRRYSVERTLTYFDPPYVTETRSHHKQYKHETIDDFHVQAADLLHHAGGYVVVSGYACPLYSELYEAHGWERRDKEAQTNSGGSRIESIWLSPRTSQALQAGAGLPLFTLLQS